MKYILSILLLFLAWLVIQIEISRLSPCSQFTNHPELCNSDKKLRI